MRPGAPRGDRTSEPVPGAEIPAVQVHWEAFIDDLLNRTAKFPKALRVVFTQRIEATALDVLDRLIEARFNRDRASALRAANFALERLRVLLRIAWRRRYLDHAGLEHLARGIDEAGRMIGGWLRATAPAASQ